jgi:hypothetical protein
VKQNVGRIGRYGNGLLLFHTGQGGNTMVLLADTQDNLPTLLNILSSGDMSSCVIQNNIGVCGIGYSGSSFDIPTPSEEIQPAETPTPTG